MATTTILGVFDNADLASTALDELRASGLDLRDTSLVTQNGTEDNKLNAQEGALVGAAWGGLVGLVALAIPGIGPFIAGGAVAAALTGAAAGAVVGGVSGALIHSTNLPEEDAKRYEQEVYSGKTLLIVKAEESQALDVRRILARDGADSIYENQTDMIRAGAAEISVYNEAGMPISSSRVPSRIMTEAATPNSTQTYVISESNKGSALETDKGVNDAETSGNFLKSSEAAEDIKAEGDRPGQVMNNGARVISYEDENQAANKSTTEQ